MGFFSDIGASPANGGQITPATSGTGSSYLDSLLANGGVSKGGTQNDAFATDYFDPTGMTGYRYGPSALGSDPTNMVLSRTGLSSPFGTNTPIGAVTDFLDPSSGAVRSSSTKSPGNWFDNGGLALLALTLMAGGAMAGVGGAGGAAGSGIADTTGLAAPASSGTGLSLGGGGLGLTASPGAGMTFAAGGGGTGLTAPAWFGGDMALGAGGAAGAGLAAGGSEGGGGTGLGTGSASGADMDTFFGGGPSNLGGGAAASQNPSILQYLGGLVKNGGLSMDAVTQALSSPTSLVKTLMGTKSSGALGFGQPIAQIIAGLEGRRKASALQRQMQLPPPGDVTSMPGYQAGLEAVQRSLAAQGYQGSGNMMAALHRYGGDMYNQYVNQRIASAQGQAGPTSAGLSSMALLANGLGNLVGKFL